MERHIVELLFRTIWALLRNILEASSLFAQLMNVLDSSRLEETVACHHSLKQASKPSSGIIGFVYVDKNGEVSPPPENRNGVRVFKEPRRENLEEGEKGILCAILPGAAGEMFDEADIDSVLRDGTYSLKRRSQCLHLVQFPSEFGTNLVVMQELQDKIQIGVDQIFGGMNSDSNTNATIPSTRPLSDPSRIQPYDVLCDRNDERAPKHYGNRKFALVVSAYTTKHKNLHITEKRANVAKAIVQTVRRCEPGGRFLAKTKHGTWKDIGDRLAVRWVGLILKKSAGP
mmetsp:Transcript_9916/g.22891  ORF Transcript_9916/g.22891 Transcript_9916/m.22891 type:complete len:286 (-) Transcript_9916:15-872(-)